MFETLFSNGTEKNKRPTDNEISYDHTVELHKRYLEAEDGGREAAEGYLHGKLEKLARAIQYPEGEGYEAKDLDNLKELNAKLIKFYNEQYAN